MAFAIALSLTASDRAIALSLIPAPAGASPSPRFSSRPAPRLGSRSPRPGAAQSAKPGLRVPGVKQDRPSLDRLERKHPIPVPIVMREALPRMIPTLRARSSITPRTPVSRSHVRRRAWALQSQRREVRRGVREPRLTSDLRSERSAEFWRRGCYSHRRWSRRQRHQRQRCGGKFWAWRRGGPR